MNSTKTAEWPRFSLRVFAATSLLGFLIAIVAQWTFRNSEPLADTPGQTTVAYMASHSGEAERALLVAVQLAGDKVEVVDVDEHAPKWIGSAWEQLVAAQLDSGDFDRAFEIVRAVPNPVEKGASLHNILHVIRASPRASLPVFGSTSHLGSQRDVAASDNVAAEPAAPLPVEFPTVGSFKRQTEDLPLDSIPQAHRAWVELTLERLRAAEAILATLEPLPVVYGAWMDIKGNYESLQQWRSANKARETAIQVLVAFDRSRNWQSIRQAYIWPGVRAMLWAFGVGIGGVLLDYSIRAFRFYSGRGLALLVRDEEFRKHLGLVAKDVQSALILPGRENSRQSANVDGELQIVKPR